MAANPVALFALAGAFLFLKSRGSVFDMGTWDDGNGDGNGGQGADIPDGASVMDGTPPDWSKPTPDGGGLISTSVDIQLRMGTGGMINEVLLQGPEGSDPNEDLRLKEGLGHERLVIGFNTPGVWEITLAGIAGDTQEPFTRSWTFDAQQARGSQITKSCPPGQIWSCVQNPGQFGQVHCECRTTLADTNESTKG